MIKKPQWNFENPPLVRVEWMDAIANAHWFDPEEIIKWEKTNWEPIIDVGYLLFQDKRRIVIASRRSNFKGEGRRYGMIQWIPRPWVKSIKRLKVPK